MQKTKQTKLGAEEDKMVAKEQFGKLCDEYLMHSEFANTIKTLKWN